MAVGKAGRWRRRFPAERRALVLITALGATLFGACGGRMSSSTSPGGSGARGASGGSAAGPGQGGSGAAAGAAGTWAGAGGGASGGAGADAGGPAGAGGVPGGIPGISCQGTGKGLHDCGPDQESCCTRPLVPGGSFYRDYDGDLYPDKSYPATVSDFRLDKYEISVGRFRNFIAAWDAGWRPAEGAGKHAHLNGGKGLANSAPDLGYERGWRQEWDTQLPASPDGWNNQLTHNTQYGGPTGACPWSADDSYDGRHPVACIDWYDAYAFCIWDGGFLPSEAEWNYAASGGDEQRVYPWSSPPTSTDIDCGHAVYVAGFNAPCASSAQLVGSDSPAGDGRWGQADLAGNVLELVLDGYAKPYGGCVDCAYGVPDDVYPSPAAIERGGGFTSYKYGLLAAARGGLKPDSRYKDLGARCAYSP